MHIQQIVDFTATILKSFEELAYPSAKILPHFPRSIQLDYYSCGSKSVFTILRYYNKRCTPQSVEKALNTDEDGTAVSDIKRVFKRFGLKCRTLRKPKLRDLVTAIDNGCPVLISMYDGWHYSVVYGYSDRHVFVMNPSLGSMGSVLNAVPKRKYVRIWDKWGIIVYE